MSEEKLYDVTVYAALEGIVQVRATSEEDAVSKCFGKCPSSFTFGECSMKRGDAESRILSMVPKYAEEAYEDRDW